MKTETETQTESEALVLALAKIAALQGTLRGVVELNVLPEAWQTRCEADLDVL